ncbi:UvrD-helicase domain-containing protein, partial [Candidatus Uhrbacteria bacterium]|nr:UvrD-helicase domain-containing protein [Candidatus Uhrbacteria bacterium]
HTLSHQFQYVLVDEYQDTNRIQAAIVARLASVHGNVFVVGDDAQSIYSFRAADVGNILQFSEAFPGAKVFRIETNYRSTPQILKVANAAIAENEAQYKKTLRPVRVRGVRPQLIQSRSMEEEAQWVAQQILKLRDDGEPLQEIAVLFRATHLSQFLEMELVKRDIPYDYRGGIRFFERAHVKDVLAFLKVLTNPKDEAAWLRVLRMQEGIGDVGAIEIIERIRNQESGIKGADEGPSWSSVALSMAPRLAHGWSDFLSMITPIIHNSKFIIPIAEPAAMIRAIAKGSYRDHLEAEYPNWEERLDDLEQLALFAEKYTDTAAFLADTSLTELFGVERVGVNASEQERIVLSTIHQAKGLEWRAVFIIGLTSAALPNRRALLEEGGVEEERRLFYVAITRAKEQLALSYALSGGVESSYLHAPSPFLSEIPSELLEPIGVSRPPASSRWRERDDDGEPMIVLDAIGERKKSRGTSEEVRVKRSGFLRDVSEL